MAATHVTTTIPVVVNELDPLEYILPPIALAVFLSYMAIFFLILRIHPMRINLGLKMLLRRRWAKHCVRDNQALVAVQTLRNSQNASSVFCSASVIVAFFAFQQAVNLNSIGLSYQANKFYVLGASLVCAFLVFGISIRDAETCGYLCFNKTDEKEFNDVEIPLVARGQDADPHLRRQMTIANIETRAMIAAKSAATSIFFFSMGLRLFYFAFCVGGWIASPIACLVIAVCMVFMMLVLDRTTSSALYEKA